MFKYHAHNVRHIIQWDGLPNRMAADDLPFYTETFFSSCRVLFSADRSFTPPLPRSICTSFQNILFRIITWVRGQIHNTHVTRGTSQLICLFAIRGLKTWNLASSAGTSTSYSISAWLCEELKLSWRILGGLASRSA